VTIEGAKMIAIAGKAGISLGSLERLLNGTVAHDVAGRLSMDSVGLQLFIDGVVKPICVRNLGGTTEQLQTLRDRVGREGAIGIVVGLLLSPRPRV